MTLLLLMHPIFAANKEKTSGKPAPERISELSA